jgi:DNA polymerase/3'-5' exonuclease PolX
MRHFPAVIQELEDIVATLPNTGTAVFRKRAYLDVIDRLRAQRGPVTAARLAALPLTQSMREKLAAMAARPYAPAPRDRADPLMDVGGIGPAKAADLRRAGIRTVADLRRPDVFDTLSNETQAHLRWPPTGGIPRAEVAELERGLRAAIPRVHFDITGSYRRGRERVGDIDMLVVGDTDTLNRVLAALGGLVPVHIYARGPDRVSAIVQLPQHGFARLDVFTCPPEEYPTQLQYSTGSRGHNIKLRARAKRLGFMLNQRGLWRGTRRIPTKTEADVYQKLGLEPPNPQDRV